MTLVAEATERTTHTTAEEFVDRLDGKLQALLVDIEQSDVYRLLEDPEIDPVLFTAAIKNILLEIFSYDSHVTEAAFTAIGRFPKKSDALMRPLIYLELEEVGDGDMALNDYLRLGGDGEFARTRPLSPATFAMAATVRMMAERGPVFGYLGFVYILEALTPTLGERLLKRFASEEFPAEARHFTEYHAKVDVGHARRFRDLIVKVVEEHPQAAKAIEYGFDCFPGVWPSPIWREAVQRARDEVHG